MNDISTIRSMPEIDLGWGKFIEVSLKMSGQGNEFISLSRGEYWLDGKGNSGKRYKKSISIPNNNGAIEGVIGALQKLMVREDTPSESEVDKG